MGTTCSGSQRGEEAVINQKECVVSQVLCVALLVSSSCSKKSQDPGAESPGAQAAITNRLDVGPEVRNNLGISFERAVRGRLGTWRKVPGHLEVPENRRWMLRAPASGRLAATAARWQRVEKGQEVARLLSPDLQASQRGLALAQANEKRAEQELATARTRHAQSDARVVEAAAIEAAGRQRLEEIQSHTESGNALLVKELLDLRRAIAESGRVSLDVAILRDGLAASVAAKAIELDQARLAIGEELQRLAMLTGLDVAELAKVSDGVFAAQQLDTLIVAAPSTGIVVELSATEGERVEQGSVILQVWDSSELRFRGQIPESDLGELAAGNRVRVEFPSPRLTPIDTMLNAMPPVADATTRMVRIEATVPNGDGVLAHGISAIGQVLVRESANEEILIPIRCVVFDGLEAIVFRRDPANDNVVIRTPVELGARAMQRVEVLAGVLEGDAVVADGLQQLKQTGLGKPPEGGHFHADGTFHSEHK